MNQKPKKPARRMVWQLAFWMTLVGMGPLLIMAGQGYHCAHQAIVERAHAQLSSVLETKKRQIEMWLDETEREMIYLAEAIRREQAKQFSPAADYRPCSAEQKDFVQSMLGRGRHYRALALFDRNWGECLVAGSPPGHWEPGLTEQLENLSASSTEMVICRSGGTTGRNVSMQAGLEVRSVTGDLLGYVLADLDLSASLGPLLEDSTGLGQAGKSYLLFQDSGLFYSPAGLDSLPELSGRQLLDLLTSHNISHHGTVEYRDYRGVRVLGVSSPLPRLKASVFVDFDYDELFGWLKRLRTRAVVTGSITLVLVLLLAVKSSRRLSSPLNQLSMVARKIASGRRQERVGTLDGYEAQEVARAFNHMLNELDASQKKLVNSASLAAVGELSSSIVHEMRNPLSSIKLNIQSLSRKVADDPAYAELGQIAGDQVLRLEQMLSELLNYAKPVELEITSVNIGEILERLVAAVRQPAEEKDISIGLELAGGRIVFPADSEQLFRALLNLAINAVEAAGAGGKVTISAGITENEGGGLEIKVMDSGPGIAAADLDKVFQPFFTSKKNGTGLGLSNVKKIAEAHGGSISAGNGKNGGAVFTLRLPGGEKLA